MGAHVEWDVATQTEVATAPPGEEMADGQKIDPDRWALVLGAGGGGCLVVEGTPKELLAFSVRVQEAAMEALRAEYDAAYEHVTRQ